jgi:hypothetical protein
MPPVDAWLVPKKPIAGIAGNGPSYKRMLRRDPCSYCFGVGGTIDHIIPRSIGDDGWWNLTGACERCNGKKGTNPALQFFMEIQRDQSKVAADANNV